MTKHNDQERAQFEAAYKAACLARPVPRFADAIFAKDHCGDYVSVELQNAWWAWQARAQLPAGGVVPAGVAVPEAMRVAAAAEMNRLGYGHHEIHAESILIAAGALHPVSGEQKPDMADAYCGAMEDRNIWKRRALEAETKLRTYDQRIVDLGVLSMRTAVEKDKQPAAQDVSGQINQAAAHIDDEVARLISIAVPRLREHGSHSLATMLEAAVDASLSRAQGGAK